MTTIATLISVPQSNTGGTTPAAALGAGTIAVQGFLRNVGSSDIYLVSVSDNDAKVSPTDHGIRIEPDEKIPLKVGCVLSELGVISDIPGGKAFLLAQ